MITVFYLIVDYGDGSSGVSFYRNEATATALLDDEQYYANDGAVGSFQIPDGPNSISFAD